MKNYRGRTPRRIKVVACTYSMPASVMRRRLEVLARQLGTSFEGVIVDNRGRDLPPDSSAWAHITGSNVDLDFSAYVEGLDVLVGTGEPEPREILFLNDSLLTGHASLTNLREVVGYAELVGQINVPAMCGKTDGYWIMCYRNPWSDLPFYVASYCFVLNRAAFGILRSMPHMADADGLGRDLAIRDPGWATGLQQAFREYIRAFMLYRHPAFCWPGLDKYAIDDKLLSIKARGIYFEHRLSGAVGRAGCLISINSHGLTKWRVHLAEKLVAKFGFLNALRTRNR